MKKLFILLLSFILTSTALAQGLSLSNTAILFESKNTSQLSGVSLRLQVDPFSINKSLSHLTDPGQSYKGMMRKNPFNQKLTLKTKMYKEETFMANRRNRYSFIWAFASLNYLYADLVGLMDVNLLTQYQTGIVNGVEMTPGFLTGAALYMQIPLSNVFLPQVIKNDRALRWVQIVSGTVATLAQSASLFVGEPTPYYMLFSAVEIAATTYITIDAIKWKPGKRKKKRF